MSSWIPMIVWSFKFNMFGQQAFGIYSVSQIQIFGAQGVLKDIPIQTWLFGFIGCTKNGYLECTGQGVKKNWVYKVEFVWNRAKLSSPSTPSAMLMIPGIKIKNCRFIIIVIPGDKNCSLYYMTIDNYTKKLFMHITPASLHCCIKRAVSTTHTVWWGHIWGPYWGNNFENVFF